MLSLRLGADALGSVGLGIEVNIAGKLVIEEASELAYLMAENAELNEDPSKIEGDIVLIDNGSLLDKAFDEIPPLVGGIYAYVLGAVIYGRLDECSKSPFMYQLSSITKAELVRDNGDRYQYNFNNS